MDGRIARLESDVAHIRTDVTEMKADIRDLRDKMDAGFAEERNQREALRDKMDSGFEDLRNKMDEGFRDVRDKMESGFADVRQSIAQLSIALERVSGRSSVTSLETRIWGLITIGGVLFIVARALKWI